MKKYWYTILLTITLSGAAAARMIPDSVAEALAAEIIDIGTDLRMTVAAYSNGNQISTAPPSVSESSDLAQKSPASAQELSDMLPEATASAQELSDMLPESPASAQASSAILPEASASAQEPPAQESSNSVQASAPEVPEAPDSMQEAPSLPANPDFSNVLFIGDSRTAGLSEYGNLGQAEVFADSGMSVFNLFDSRVKTRSGSKLTLNEVLSEHQFQTIYLMLGINELGYEYGSIIKKYQSVVDTIQSMQPEAVLVLQANLHVTEKKSSSSSTYNNEKINSLNSGIQAIAEENGCFYLDVNPVFDDENGNLRADYSTDGSHILGKYYSVWVDWLKNPS